MRMNRVMRECASYQYIHTHIQSEQNEHVMLHDPSTPQNIRFSYNNSSQSSLRIRSDRIGLVQYDDFKGWVGIVFLLLLFLDLHFVVVFFALVEVTGGTLGATCIPNRKAGKVLDFVSYDRNATLVTGVQFQYATTPLRRMPQLSTQSQSHGCLIME